MNIIFKTLHIEHFLSFGVVDIDLQQPGYTLVSGRNENPNDNAKSNGSGKSAIWDALSYCITGSTIRGTKDIVNIKEDGGCLVEAVFAVNNVDYKIVRTKGHKQLKTTCKLFINGEDKSGKGLRETQALIEEYLPDLTAQLIGSVIIFGQGLPNRFSNNTPSGRKEVLEKLSKSDFMIEDLRSKINSRITFLNGRSKEFSDNILRLSTQREMKEQEIRNAENKKAQLTNPEDLNRQKVQTEKLLEEARLVIQNDSQVLNDSQAKLDTLTLSYSQINKNMNNDLFRVQQEYKELRKPIEDAKQVTTAKIYSLNNEIKRIKNIKDICPTCGQKIPNITKPDTTQQEKESIELNNQLQEYNNRLLALTSSYDEKENKIKESYNNQTSTLQQECNKLSATISRLNHKLKINRDEELRQKDLLNKINSEIQLYQMTLQNLTNVINEGNKFIEEINSKILYYNNEWEKLKIRLDIENKFMTIIKRDFRGVLLKNVIDYIEFKAKEYARQIFDNDRIGFSLEGNDIDITYDNKEYSSLSTGERQKVDLIVQFALRDMLCKYLDFDSNILVCDELFDGLDSIGCNKVVDLIANLTNITSIYIVSHRQDLSLPVDRNLTIVKDARGISSIQNM